MNIDLYERIWMWGVGLMLTLFFATIAFEMVSAHRMPPSHVETIDPRKVLSDPRFSSQGVRVEADGSIHAHVVALTFTWLPGEMTLPAGREVTFHITSIDVTHGFEIVRTNAQTMVIPGYISQFTTTFDPGEYLVVCNEYCGVGHHTMYTKFHVVPAAQWTPPAATAVPAAPEASHAH